MTTKTFGKKITRESISFMDFDNLWSCFSNWFQPKGFGQEIDKFYNGDEITLDDIAKFLHSVRDLTCNQNCNVPLVKVGQTRTFTVERDRFWDNEGSTNDCFILGEITITRYSQDHTKVEVKEINEYR